MIDILIFLAYAYLLIAFVVAIFVFLAAYRRGGWDGLANYINKTMPLEGEEKLTGLSVQWFAAMTIMFWPVTFYYTRKRQTS